MQNVKMIYGLAVPIPPRRKGDAIAQIWKVSYDWAEQLCRGLSYAMDEAPDDCISYLVHHESSCSDDGS